MRFTLILLAFFFFPKNSSAQSQPKVVVGIVVDQMRYDYLYKFSSKYGEGGFKRMIRDGFSCENAHFNYAPTYTGPGHSSIYTGTTPSVNGIIGNNWYSRKEGKNVYVTGDSNYKTVGADSKSGQQAPTRMMSSTITDELRLNSNFRSKVVGVCIKDRGGILPAGHIPNACYWFDAVTGRWITSTYYPDSEALPFWVEAYNLQLHQTKFFNQTWEKSSSEPYAESFEGWNEFEGRLEGFESGNGDFPYKLSPLPNTDKPYSQILSTPFGNEMTLDLAILALDNMDMGSDEFTDFLCLSFSSTDYAGHKFGIHSEEVEDIYIRLDQSLEKLLNALDKRYGKGNYLTFLTADHGGTETPEHQRQIGIPAGVSIKDSLGAGLLALLDPIHENAIASIINQQVYIKDEVKNKAKMAERIADYLNKQEGVYAAFTREDLMALPDDFPFISLIRKGIHPKRSGDVIYLLEPGWHPDGYFLKTGATHGSQYRYDTHVPLLWYGAGVPQGSSHKKVEITDIAPTVAAMLHIQEPNGCIGEPIEALLD